MRGGLAVLRLLLAVASGGGLSVCGGLWGAIALRLLCGILAVRRLCRLCGLCRLRNTVRTVRLLLIISHAGQSLSIGNGNTFLPFLHNIISCFAQ